MLIYINWKACLFFSEVVIYRCMEAMNVDDKDQL